MLQPRSPTVLKKLEVFQAEQEARAVVLREERNRAREEVGYYEAYGPALRKTQADDVAWLAERAIQEVEPLAKGPTTLYVDDPVQDEWLQAISSGLSPEARECCISIADLGQHDWVKVCRFVNALCLTATNNRPIERRTSKLQARVPASLMEAAERMALENRCSLTSVVLAGLRLALTEAPTVVNCWDRAGVCAVVKIDVRVTPSLARAVRGLAKDSSASVSDVVRLGLELLVEERKV